MLDAGSLMLDERNGSVQPICHPLSSILALGGRAAARPYRVQATPGRIVSPCVG